MARGGMTADVRKDVFGDVVRGDGGGIFQLDGQPFVFGEWSIQPLPSNPDAVLLGTGRPEARGVIKVRRRRRDNFLTPAGMKAAIERGRKRREG